MCMCNSCLLPLVLQTFNNCLFPRAQRISLCQFDPEETGFLTDKQIEAFIADTVPELVLLEEMQVRGAVGG